MSLILELLDKKKHDIKNFDCNNDEMTVFLKQFALKNQKLGLSKSWVLIGEDKKETEKSKVMGYFTLSIQTINPTLIKDKKLPKYPLPVTLLARIAVDKAFQGQGLGKTLLFLALKKTVELNDNGLATYGLVLEVLNDELLGFYKKFNFLESLDSTGKRLFVSMQTIRSIL